MLTEWDVFKSEVKHLREEVDALRELVHAMIPPELLEPATEPAATRAGGAAPALESLGLPRASMWWDREAEVRAMNGRWRAGTGPFPALWSIEAERYGDFDPDVGVAILNVNADHRWSVLLETRRTFTPVDVSSSTIGFPSFRAALVVAAAIGLVAPSKVDGYPRP